MGMGRRIVVLMMKVVLGQALELVVLLQALVLVVLGQEVEQVVLGQAVVLVEEAPRVLRRLHHLLESLHRVPQMIMVLPILKGKAVQQIIQT